MQNVIPVTINFCKRFEPTATGRLAQQTMELTVPLEITVPDPAGSYVLAKACTTTCMIDRDRHIQINIHSMTVVPSNSLSTFQKDRTYREHRPCQCPRQLPIAETRNYSKPIRFASACDIELARFSSCVPCTVIPKRYTPAPTDKYRSK
jgi:hypothetical protein